MPSSLHARPHIEVKSRRQLRQWLQKNHPQPQGLWLVTYKKHVTRWYLPYPQIVQELLCFGWIDAVVGKVDADKVKRYISPRRKGSGWSTVNKKFIKDLIRDGLMTEVGLDKITKAKKDGSWMKLQASPPAGKPKSSAKPKWGRRVKKS